jgi:alanine racemase
MRDHVGHLTIDLGALVANWHALAARVAPAECAAVVKANAYGLGIEAVVPALIKAGCRTFFVAHLAEARRVRALGAEARIYVLNGFPLQGADDYLAHRLSPVLGTLEEARFWAGLRDHHPAAPLAALHLETGMNRLGIHIETAKHLVVDGLVSHLGLDLVLSHFIAAEEHENPLNPRQIADFTNAAAMIRKAATLPGPYGGLQGAASGKIGLSLCNSAGIFLPQQPYCDLIRPGYALYGGNPTPGQPNPMRAVVRLDAPIMQIRTVKAGESVGYNAQWIAKRDSRIAVISCG